MANPTTATVGEDAAFTGRFTGQDLVVLGRLEGDVELKGSFRVGKQGHVKAKVGAVTVEIEGEFEGEVRADTLSLSDTARAKGTFIAKRLNVREGAILEGAVNPTGPKPAAAPVTAPAKPAAPVPAAPTPAPVPTTSTTPATPSSSAAPSSPGPTSGAPGASGPPKPEGGNPGA
jgi:cytoskeletal protein CcmA (bactofilin family)